MPIAITTCVRGGPTFQVARPLIGFWQISSSRLRVALNLSDTRGADQTGNLSGKRRRRVAWFLFPTILTRSRPLFDDEIRGGLDVFAPGVSIRSV